jgi:type I restriction enzyme M protein
MLCVNVGVMSKRHANNIGNLESLFGRLEELVLANSGENEFEEVFKLIVAKLWDEHAHNGEHFRVYDTESNTFNAISTLLREAEKGWSGILEPLTVPALTPAHLQVCVEALSKHTILDEGLEVMDSFFEFMVSKGAKGAKGQYFTPRHVIELCVRMLKPKRNETVLDPACGSGGFLFHTLDYVRRNEPLSQNEIQEYCKTRLWGFDMDARAVHVAKALMVLAGDGKANLMRLNSLLTPSINQTLLPMEDSESSILTVEDVCRTRIRKHKGFDIIMTNPPFAGEVREKHILENYSVANGKSRVERDVLFLERCVQLLKPGGRLAIILPHNKFAAESYSYMREWLMRKMRVLGVVGLGRNTFLPHTHQKTSILFAQKREKVLEQTTEKMFFAISEQDGKNSKGQFVFKSSFDSDARLWDKVEHDFDDVENNFSQFCESEKIAMGTNQ